MRITTQAKAKTRVRILNAAARLFTDQGLSSTSTRELARSSGIAAGTLFNYFSSKEALALELISEALERGIAGYEERRRGDESLEEDLFAHIAAGLRELEPYRSFVGEVIETALSPFSQGSALGGGERARLRHLEAVRAILGAHDLETPDFVAVHLYWTLYLGILAFWAADDSPREQDTLAVLDQSVRLFVSTIERTSKGTSDGNAR